ncbi:MAG: sn-glycerol-3-phosphate ABC transporter ATP-binding protein UgpC [Planctomycetota bacterium]|nr:MAG: sn-glycerol-3-phosphate ABC transporter ATP-binding protein UgpC [Planctomycetota bacterium]
MATISLDRVGKIYPGGVRAVEGVDLRIAHGEFIVLVGPSGCGKSTLLRMIAGLETITEGVMKIDDLVVNELPPQARDIAMVFQNYALYPHMNVHDNMAFGLLRRRTFPSRFKSIMSSAYRAGRRVERIEISNKVNAAATTLGISQLLGRRPAALSGGQRQRVALGRALVREPKVFLLDEPLSNLDAKLRVEMRAELRMLHRRLGVTMVYVTHDQEEAMSLGDRVVVLKNGLVQQIAAPQEMYSKPANRFVAEFVGTPTMNMLEGALTMKDNWATFAAKSLQIQGAVDAWKSLAQSGPQSAVLGIRPEHVLLNAAGGFAATVEAVEHYGDRMDVVVQTSGQRLVARCSPDASIQEGKSISVAVDLTRAHLFEQNETGMRMG